MNQIFKRFMFTVCISYINSILSQNIVLDNNTHTQTLLLWSHGLADTYKQAQWYAKSYKKDATVKFNEHYLFSCPWLSFNYPDATLGRLRVNYKETSFGQENEIACLRKAYKKLMSYGYKKYNNNYDIILMGMSRGASNLLIFAGSHELHNVKAIIVESPYYTFSEVISNIMQKNNIGWVPLSYGESLAEFIFKKYNRYGASPAKMLENIAKDIPILIICSKEDQLVPCFSSINIYKKLVTSGHKHTYILIVDHGQHAKILSGQNGKKYQSVVHAFYKKYNLPYNPSIAANGEQLLLECQPDINIM